MIIIGPNKKSLSYRILILFVLWAFFFYFYNHIVWANWDVLEIVNLAGIGAATLWYTPVIFITVLLRPVKVTITPDALIVSRILTGKKTLAFSKMESCSTKSFLSASRSHESVKIVYQGNKTLKIADVNVETITPILEVLRANNISYTGHSEKQLRSFRRRQVQE